METPISDNPSFSPLAKLLLVKISAKLYVHRMEHAPFLHKTNTVTTSTTTFTLTSHNSQDFCGFLDVMAVDSWVARLKSDSGG